MHGDCGQGGTYYYEKENKNIDRLILYFLILALVALTLWTWWTIKDDSLNINIIL